MKLSEYSIGVGDRFSHQAQAQLKAIMAARDTGKYITPVWNKSYREHTIIGSSPGQTKRAVERAVGDLGWDRPYFVDADHITFQTVDFFLEHANYFTIDVSEYIGRDFDRSEVDRFVRNQGGYIGEFLIPGITQPFIISANLLEEIAKKYLPAAREAKKIYSKIQEFKGKEDFVTEVSMDEVEDPQSPVEIFFILKLLDGIPVNTFAPKFIGQFYKGIDYIGDVAQFSSTLDQMFHVIRFAGSELNLPGDLKLSIHSGSDKFSLYPVIRELARRHQQGFHLKTAGTTWLEEVIGLALSGDEGLKIAIDMYAEAYDQREELCRPYSSVVDINPEKLPDPSVVRNWNGKYFAHTLRHVPDHPEYNSHFRQLMHVGYKIAARMGDRFTRSLKKHEHIIADQVYTNILERHIKKIFP